MEEDKKLQSLLKNFGMQETSAGFDEKLMQKIAAIKRENITSKPLINKTLQRILIVVFVAVIISLLIISLSINPRFVNANIFPSDKIYMQLFYFFISFWIVMLLNVWWNRKSYNLKPF